jgi:hypothetical protein
VDGQRLYRLSAERAPDSESDAADSKDAAPARRAPQRVARPRR